jgi:hypothetical protein
MRYLDGIFGRLGFARFAAKLMRAIREASGTDELRFDAAERRILLVGDGKVVGAINLANLYGNYRRTPRARRPEFLQVCVRMALTEHRELPDEFEAASPDLRPRLWARSVLEHHRLLTLLDDSGGGELDAPSEPVGEHLVATPVYDRPESVQSIIAENLAGSGVTFYEAMEVARQNLEESTAVYGRIGENLYCFTSGDSYDASRLLLIDHIQGLEVAGKPLAMVPTRDQLYLTGTADEVGLAMMAELSEKALQEPYPLSAIPLILDDGAWSDWMPPEDHPLHRRFRHIATNWLGVRYAEQKKLLHDVHRRKEIDVFVASYSVVQKDGELVSYCVWGAGVDSLLPVTQKVAFMRKGRERLVALGHWARVVEVAGGLMEPTEHYPPRYRVREIPDETALEAIGLGEM